MKKFMRFNEQTIKTYMIENGLFDSLENVICLEIGDGNLNYIFRIHNQQGTKSFIIKQADNFARISRDLIVSRNRNAYEAAAIQYAETICTGYVPRIYKVDKSLSCFIMEDLGENNNIKSLFIKYQIIDGIASDLADYLSKQCFYSSSLYLDAAEHERMVQAFDNPEMCNITAKLVFEDPYQYKEVIKTYQRNLDYVDKRIIHNPAFINKIQEYKNSFLEKKQSFIHGDLHTGSLCYSNNQIKVLDYEFAFYGPIGYDVGNFLAHCIFAVVHAGVTRSSEAKAISFAEWLVNTITQFYKLFFEYTHQKMKDDKVFGDFIKEVVKDINGFCAIEIIRRILGIAKSKELEDINDNKIAEVEKQLLDFSVELILHDDIFGVDEYANFLNEYIGLCKSQLALEYGRDGMNEWHE